MKIRDGFVSNSSSSSFVCDICGRADSGYDASPEDLYFVRLSCDHTICEREVLKISDEDYIQYVKDYCEKQLKEDENTSYYKESLEINKKAQTLTNRFDAEDLLSIYFDSKYIKEQCPICTNTVILDKDFINYLLKTYNINKDEEYNKIRKTFKNRKEFLDFLKAKS